MRHGLLLAALAGGLLAGCSSSDDGDDDGIDFGEPQSFAALAAQGDALALDVEDAIEAGGGFTDPASLPTSGSATYEGVVSIDPTFDLTSAPDAMIGELNLGVDFGDADTPLSGEAGNFVTGDDEQLDGRLVIGDGTLDRGADPNGNGWTMSGDIVGTLTGADTAIEVDGNLLGDFAGPQAGYATGIVQGIVTVGEQAEQFGGNFDAAVSERSDD